MKIKKNQLVKAEIGYIDERTGEMYDPKTVYFTKGEAKSLRSNSKNIRFWDGCNHQKTQIQNLRIVDYTECVIQPKKPSPPYSTYWDIEIDGKKIELISSNMSRHLTPYWEVIENW